MKQSLMRISQTAVKHNVLYIQMEYNIVKYIQNIAYTYSMKYNQIN